MLKIKNFNLLTSRRRYNILSNAALHKNCFSRFATNEALKKPKEGEKSKEGEKAKPIVKVVKKKKDEKDKDEEKQVKFTKEDELRALLLAYKVSTPVPIIELEGEEREREKAIFEAYKKNKPLQRQKIKEDAERLLKAKTEAMAQLPEKFKEEASKMDLSLMPPNRWVPTYRVPPTFPFPNFTNNKGIPVSVQNPFQKNKNKKKRASQGEREASSVEAE